MIKQIMVLAKERAFYKEISSPLMNCGYGVTILNNFDRIIERLGSKYFDLLLLELDALPFNDPLGFFKSVKEVDPYISVIFVSNNDQKLGPAVNAIKAGVADYIWKPLDIKILLRSLNKIKEERKSFRKRHWFHRTIAKESNFCGIIGRSHEIRQIFAIIEKVAETDSTVFIAGETGVGKELIARAIHSLGSRKDRPFVPINCGALTESLLESELFGYEKGAFTGALKTKPGKFEIAHEGTLFLDEIGDVSGAMQVKLLRALQERRVERVGGSQAIDVDVRIISATNQNIREKINTKNFRLDLFYRINVIVIQVPPLRERAEDIPLLVEYFMERLNERMNRMMRGITPRAMQLLMDHYWPGNVRELQNVLERAYISSDSDVIDHLSFSQYLEPSSSGVPMARDPDIPYSQARALLIERFEKHYFTEALRRYQGNISETAQKTGVNTRTLWRKISEYKLDRSAFKKKN
ncbi:MAG: sigma-54 dependent transcriptional regulator [Desulfobaccales bacterium]